MSAAGGRWVVAGSLDDLRRALTQPAVCPHGEDADLCRDLMPEDVREAVDFAHRHAYEYACGARGDRDTAEDYAAHVAAEVARSGGDLTYGDHARDFPEWLAAR